jgi:uncharacterized membrane protein
MHYIMHENGGLIGDDCAAMKAQNDRNLQKFMKKDGWKYARIFVVLNLIFCFIFVLLLYRDR